MFLEELASIDWEGIYFIQNFQSAFSSFYDKYVQLFDKHFPKRSINVKFQNQKPWLTEGLRNCIKQKKGFIPLLVVLVVRMTLLRPLLSKKIFVQGKLFSSVS